MSRTYDIRLSCGCWLSLDGGGGLIPCFSDNCKYEEEHWLHPDYVEREVEIFRRNYYERPPTEEEIAEVRKEAEKEYKARIKEHKTKLAEERIAERLRGEK